MWEVVKASAMEYSCHQKRAHTHWKTLIETAIGVTLCSPQVPHMSSLDTCAVGDNASFYDGTTVGHQYLSVY